MFKFNYLHSFVSFRGHRSYLEETCFHIVIQAMLYTVKNLPTLHNYVAAEESAKDNLAVHESFAEDRYFSPSQRPESCRVRKLREMFDSNNGNQDKGERKELSSFVATLGHEKLDLLAILK